MTIGVRSATVVVAAGLLLVGLATASRADPRGASSGTPRPVQLQLNGVSAVSARDVWAVGTVWRTRASTFIEHWDGVRWSRVPSPSLGGRVSSELNGVSALSADDAWAVGSAGSRALVLHWDGSAWTAVTMARPVYLNAVSAVGAQDVWAVGGAARSSVTLHWDGRSWSKVPSPDPGGDGTALVAVSAVAADDAWAVGEYSHLSGRPRRTLVEHWDGSRWLQFASPSPGGRHGNLLNGVTGTSHSDAWAVGNYQTASRAKTLILHWDGHSWTRVPSPSPGAIYNVLTAVSAASTDDVWAVGDFDSARRSVTLIEHWDGSHWTRVGSRQPPGSRGALLQGVSAISRTHAYTAGFWFGSGDGGGLTQQWDGHRWTRP